MPLLSKININFDIIKHVGCLTFKEIGFLNLCRCFLFVFSFIITCSNLVIVQVCIVLAISLS